MAFPIGTSEQSLMDTINADNALTVPLEVGSLYFGKPVKIADGFISIPTVTMYNNEDYEGYATLEYQRYNLSEMFGTIRPVITDIAYGSVHAMLPMLNRRLGLNLTTKDVIEQKLTWTVGSEERVNIQITADPLSLGFEGSFIISYIKIRPALSEKVTKTKLPVMRHPGQIVEGKLSLDLQTWGIDFTDHASKLQVRSGIWVGPTAVVDLMAQLGFANWPWPARNQVTIHSTADLPYANKLYSKVAIQTGVIGPDYQGTAYFHFN